MRYIVEINEELLLNSSKQTWIPEEYEILDDIVKQEAAKGMAIPENAIKVTTYED